MSKIKPKKLPYSTRIYVPDSLCPSAYVGIDTGVKTGYAYWHPSTKQLSVKTSSLHEAMATITEILASGESIFVRVEDARQRTWFGNNAAVKAQGAGSVKRDSSAWNRFLVDMSNQYPNQLGFEMVAPKHNKTKLSEQQFAAYTGYKGRTSQHGRDAAMLVYGYQPNQVKLLAL